MTLQNLTSKIGAPPLIVHLNGWYVKSLKSLLGIAFNRHK